MLYHGHASRAEQWENIPNLSKLLLAVLDVLILKFLSISFVLFFLPTTLCHLQQPDQLRNPSATLNLYCKSAKSAREPSSEDDGNDANEVHRVIHCF